MPDIDHKILDDKQRARIRAEHRDACWTSRVDWRARALAAEALLIEERRDAAETTGRLDAIFDKLGARDTGTGGQTVEAGNARIVHDGMRRLDRAISAAARWRKVAPLIERLRAVCGDPLFTGRRPQLADCAAAILAATQEPTP